MKKIFITMAAALAVFAANAQEEVKSVPVATKALEAAQKATLDAKKNTKAAVWIKYGKALLDAYAAPSGNAMLGMSMQEMQLLGASEKPVSESQVTINGTPFVKQEFATRNLYYNADGKLAIVEVSKPIDPDALTKALDAYVKASELGAKPQEVIPAIEGINAKLNESAVTAYNLGKIDLASAEFEKAAAALATAPCSKVDSSAIYNAALTSYMQGKNERAKTFFNKCLEVNYFGTDGDVFAKLADITEKAGDKAGAKTILEEGFTKYPQSQSILVGLINYYVSSGEDTNRLFELLDGAKKNEPNNASLYYVEGNIRAKLGQEAEAVEAYKKCAEINPNYEFGYIGLGIYYYNKALALQEQASNEMDDNKYMALVADFETSLKACIEPFEKAYEITKMDDIKGSIAEYLKNACFRFRTEDPSYMAKYEKYSNAK